MIHLFPNDRRTIDRFQTLARVGFNSSQFVLWRNSECIVERQAIQQVALCVTNDWEVQGLHGGVLIQSSGARETFIEKVVISGDHFVPWGHLTMLSERSWKHYWLPKNVLRNVNTSCWGEMYLPWATRAQGRQLCKGKGGLWWRRAHKWWLSKIEREKYPTVGPKEAILTMVEFVSSRMNAIKAR